MLTSSRRQAWRSTSSQLRNSRSFDRQIRTSLNRVRLQVMAMAELVSLGLALMKASSTAVGVTVLACD